MNYGCPKGRDNFKPRCPGRIDVDTLYDTCLALWKHHVNLFLQSLRSVSLDLQQC